MKYAFAVPILPGKTDAAREWVRTVLGPRSEEWTEIQNRQGVVQETYVLQESPDGDMIIVFGEGEWIAPAQILDLSRPFDKFLREQVMEISGIDIMEFGGEAPEVLGEWRSATVPA